VRLIDKINKRQRDELERLIDWCGGTTNLGKLLGVSRQVADAWKKRGRISATSAAEAEKQTGGEFTKKTLRPDVADWRV